MILKTNKQRIVLTLSIILLIILEPKSLKFIQYLNIYSKTILSVFIIILLYSQSFFKVNKINKNQLLLLMTFIILLLFNKIVTNDSSLNSLFLITQIIVAFLFTQFVNFKIFKKYYIKIMTIIVIYSLVTTYFILNALSFFKNKLPNFFFTPEKIYLDVGLNYLYIPKYGISLRNYGPFLEPGVFQFYIILLLIFYLWSKNLKNLKKVFIYISGLISTFSTAGLISGFILIGGRFFSDIKNNKKFRKIIIIISLGAGCIYLFVPEVQKDILRAFSKLEGGGSYNSRWGSVVANLQAWSEKPIFGWGYEKGTTFVKSNYLEKWTQDNTNTILTNFAFYGVMYSSIYLYYIFKFAYNIKVNLIIRCIIFISLMLSLNSQQFMDSTIVFIIIFYSAK